MLAFFSLFFQENKRSKWMEKKLLQFFILETKEPVTGEDERLVNADEVQNCLLLAL